MNEFEKLAAAFLAESVKAQQHFIQENSDLDKRYRAGDVSDWIKEHNANSNTSDTEDGGHGVEDEDSGSSVTDTERPTENIGGGAISEVDTE